MVIEAGGYFAEAELAGEGGVGFEDAGGDAGHADDAVVDGIEGLNVGGGGLPAGSFEDFLGYVSGLKTL